MSKENDEAIEPDFKQAAAIIRAEIHKSKEQLAKHQGDLSASWKRVEGVGVDKGAAKQAFKILQMSEEGQQDYLRSLFGMMEEFGLALEVDLVDQAEGKGDGGKVSPPTKPKAKAAASPLIN